MWRREFPYWGRRQCLNVCLHLKIKQYGVFKLQKFCKKLIQKFWKEFFPTVSVKINMLFGSASIAKYRFTRKYFILKVPIRKYKLFLYSLGRRTLLLNWFLCQPPPSSFSSLCHWRNKVNWKLVASSTYYRSHTADHCNKSNVQRCWGTCPSCMLLCSSQLPSLECTDNFQPNSANNSFMDDGHVKLELLFTFYFASSESMGVLQWVQEGVTPGPGRKNNLWIFLFINVLNFQVRLEIMLCYLPAGCSNWEAGQLYSMDCNKWRLKCGHLLTWF